MYLQPCDNIVVSSPQPCNNLDKDKQFMVLTLHFSIGASVTFDYSNSTYSTYDQSYANFTCIGDISEGNCTYDVVNNCNRLTIQCHIGTMLNQSLL